MRALAARSLLASLAALALAGCPDELPDPAADGGEPDAGCLACPDECCAPGTACNAGGTACESCTPACDGKQCGDDGCNGSCGECPTGTCSAAGQCVSAPDAGPADIGPADAGAPDSGRPDASSPDIGPRPDAGPSGPPVSFKVMTWNVHDFFDEVDNPATQDDVPSTWEINAKIDDFAAVINAEKPDVLGLQEVETKDLLRRLNEKLTHKLPNYELIPTDDPRGINVALMSRLPILKSITHHEEPMWETGSKYFYSRDALEVHLEVGGNRQLAVLVNHQISKVDNDAFKDSVRLAEAKHTRVLADRIRSTTPWVAVVIVGDMNDTPASPTMTAYFEGGEWIDFWAANTTAWTFRDGTKRYRLDYVIPDKVTATWKTANTIVSSSASDHSPVTATFTYP